MRRRPAVQAFNLSFLDLISCAMAGVLVLYSIAERPEPREKTTSPALIQIDIPETSQNAEFVFHLRNGTSDHLGTSSAGGNGWIVTGTGAVFKLNDGLDPEAKLTIGLRDHDMTSSSHIPMHTLRWRVTDDSGMREEPEVTLSAEIQVQIYKVGI